MYLLRNKKCAIYIYTHIHIHTHTHIHAHPHTHTRTYTYARTHTHTRTYTHTHTHTQTTEDKAVKTHIRLYSVIKRILHIALIKSIKTSLARPWICGRHLISKNAAPRKQATAHRCQFSRFASSFQNSLRICPWEKIVQVASRVRDAGKGQGGHRKHKRLDLLFKLAAVLVPKPSGATKNEVC